VARLGVRLVTSLDQFSTLAALWVGGLGFFAFLFTRLERRMDRLESEMRDGFKALRHDLAEEFRSQRAEVAAQVQAIADAIIASRGGRT
jgi:hypothetical protein